MEKLEPLKMLWVQKTYPGKWECLGINPTIEDIEKAIKEYWRVRYIIANIEVFDHAMYYKELWLNVVSDIDRLLKDEGIRKEEKDIIENVEEVRERLKAKDERRGN